MRPDSQYDCNLYDSRLSRRLFACYCSSMSDVFLLSACSRRELKASHAVEVKSEMKSELWEHGGVAALKNLSLANNNILWEFAA